MTQPRFPVSDTASIFPCSGGQLRDCTTVRSGAGASSRGADAAIRTASFSLAAGSVFVAVSTSSGAWMPFPTFRRRKRGTNCLVRRPPSGHRHPRSAAPHAASPPGRPRLSGGGRVTSFGSVSFGSVEGICRSRRHRRFPFLADVRHCLRPCKKMVFWRHDQCVRAVKRGGIACEAAARQDEQTICRHGALYKRENRANFVNAGHRH